MDRNERDKDTRPANTPLKIRSGLRAGCDCEDDCHNCGLWGKYWCEADCTRGGAQG